MANRKAKSKLQLDGGLNLPQETAERVLITDANGDAKSSSVSTTTLSYLDATSSVQEQLDSKLEASDLTQIEQDIDDLQADVEDLQTLSGVPAASADLGTFAEDIIPDNSTIKQALQALETELAILPEPLFYAGTYDPSTNTPDLDLEANRVSGAVHYVVADGTHDFDSFGGIIEMHQGDKVVFNGTTWDKWDHTDQVASVFGRTGTITAQAGDYDASQITVTPSGNITSTDVQSALTELDTVKLNIDSFSLEFDNELVTKTTDDLIEGNTALYFTDARAVTAVTNTFADSHSIELSYDEQDNQIRSDLRVQQSITVDVDGVKLVGDDATPGNTKYYGTDASGNKGFHDIPVQGSAGDIQETSFAGSNNQETLANVTGFAFSNTEVRSFTAHISVVIEADTDHYESFDIHGIQKASGWDISVMATGDDSGVSFDITSTGQIQYTSDNYAGFQSLTMKFRAITTSI